jgi:hypothetical protein
VGSGNAKFEEWPGQIRSHLERGKSQRRLVIFLFRRDDLIRGFCCSGTRKSSSQIERRVAFVKISLVFPVS